MPSIQYEQQKNEFIECPYCKTKINLYYVTKHLKGKRCINYKKLYLQANPKATEADFLLFINDVKKGLKYSIENEEEESDDGFKK
jgi:hypothetical protein